MRKIIIFVITVLHLFILGCAEYNYVQPGKTKQQVKHDELECEYDAKKATMYIRDPFLAGYKQANLTRECMEVKGYKM